MEREDDIKVMRQAAFEIPWTTWRAKIEAALRLLDAEPTAPRCENNLILAVRESDRIDVYCKYGSVKSYEQPTRPAELWGLWDDKSRAWYTGQNALGMWVTASRSTAEGVAGSAYRPVRIDTLEV